MLDENTVLLAVVQIRWNSAVGGVIDREYDAIVLNTKICKDSFTFDWLFRN